VAEGAAMIRTKGEVRHGLLLPRPTPFHLTYPVPYPHDPHPGRGGNDSAMR
jgi:hypothetical protein